MIRPRITFGRRRLGGEWMEDLVEVVVDNEVNATGRADVRFRDPNLRRFAGVKIGEDLKIDVTDDDGKTTRIFSGEVVVVEVEQLAPGAERELLVTGYDRTHRLAHLHLLDPLKNVSLLEEIAKRAGISHNPLPKVQSVYHPGRGTGLELLEDACERQGLEWWVDSEGKLSVGEEPATSQAKETDIEVTYLDDLVQLSVRMAATAPRSVGVPFWDREGGSGGLGESSDSGTQPRLADKVPKPAWGYDQVAAEDERAGDSKDAMASAGGRMRRRHAETIVANGRLAFCDPRVRIGVKVRVTDGGSLDDKYLVTSLRHVLTRTETRTEFGTGRLRSSGLAAVVSNGGAAPPTPPLTVGIVTDVLPESTKNGGGAGLGPVAVVNLQQLDGKYETCEARLLSIGGSDEFGFFVSPRVGDEVLVGFERGDHRYPVVLGGLFGKSAKIGDVDVADKSGLDTTRLRDSLGNEFVIKQVKGEGEIKLTRAGTEPDSITMTDKGITLRAAKQFVAAVGEDGEEPKASITMKNDGSIVLKGAKLAIETTAGEVDVSAKTNVVVNAEVNASMKGGTSLKLEGTAVDVKASAMTKVAGSPVMIN